MKIFIASSEKYVGKIKEDLYIRDMYCSKSFDSQILTLEDILKDVNSSDVVILKSIWGYHLNPKEFVSQITLLNEMKVTLINGFDFITWNIDKYKYLNDIKYLNTVPTKALLIKNSDTFSEIVDSISHVAKDLNEDVLVIKPNISASGYLTYLYDCKKDNTDVVNLLKENKNIDFIIQPYRSSIDEGEVSVILINGKTLYGINRYPGVLAEKRNIEYIDILHIPNLIKDQLNNLKDYFANNFNKLPNICRVDFLKFKTSYEILEVELIDPDLFFRDIPEVVREEALSLFYAIIKK